MGEKNNLFGTLPWAVGANDALVARGGYAEYVEVDVGERGAEGLRECFLQ